jgi:hypothetical protein
MKNISGKIMAIIYGILLIVLIGIIPYFRGYLLSDKKYNEILTFYESIPTKDRSIASDIVNEYYGNWYSQQFWGKRTRIDNNIEKQKAKQYLKDNNLKK